MLKGLVSSFIITVLWVIIQISISYIKKPKNPFKAIFNGFLFSLPFVAFFYIFVPLFYSFDFLKHWSDFIHAYLGHFLFFLLYFESFKHLYRSITLNFLVDILESPGMQNNAYELQKNYSLDELIEKRLSFLEQDGYIEKKNDRWVNTEKGNKFTKFAGFFIMLFRSKTQKERN